MHRSKRFAAPATGSRSDPFRTARLKLTLLYLATIALVVSVLSWALYEFHAHDVEGLERRRSADEMEGERLAEDARAGLEEYLEHLGRSIIVADAITIAAGGVLGYLLAARTLRPIKEAVEAEQRFFANAAHDLRTPLAVMQSEAEVALRSRELDPKEARSVIQSSLEELRRMSGMVEQILDLAKTRSPRASGTRSLPRLDLGALAAETLQRLARRAEERGIRMTHDASGPVLIAGDAPALERALYNVIENAIAYTPRGGCVTVRVRRDGGDAVLDVADTGIGIAPEDLPHITEPFFRGDKARSVHSGGAGLGLTIAKTVVDEHRGSLHVTNVPGSGATVSLTFPAL